MIYDRLLSPSRFWPPIPRGSREASHSHTAIERTLIYPTSPTSRVTSVITDLFSRALRQALGSVLFCSWGSRNFGVACAGSALSRGAAPGGAPQFKLFCRRLAIYRYKPLPDYTIYTALYITGMGG